MHELYKRTVWNFRKADRLFKRMIEKRVSTTGVYRSQHQLLMYIAHHPGSSQTEIADKMEISPAAAAVSLKKLEKGGFVRKSLDESDNRINQIELTEKGIEVAEKSHRMFAEIESVMFQGFRDQEVRELQNCLERICENLENAMTELQKEGEKSE